MKPTLRLIIYSLLFSLCFEQLFAQNETTICTSGDCENGYGVQTYGENIYRGEFKDGFYHGFGFVELGDANYFGEFENGVMQGNGIISYADTSSYVGQFNNNQLSGIGMSYDLEGRISYEGGFENDVYNGKGYFYLYDKGVKVYADWKDGEFTNIISTTEIEDSIDELIFCISGDCKNGVGQERILTTLYNGENKDGYYNGVGVLSISGISLYIGSFLNGKKHGKGKEIFSNGSIHTGDYYEGKWVGHGVYNKSDGTYYVGEFVNGDKDGSGIEYDEDGRILYDGEFKEGQFHGKGYVYDFENNIKYYAEMSLGSPIAIISEEAIFSDAKNENSFCVSGDCENGYGVEEILMVRYEGNFKNGLYHGSGKLIIDGISTYTGEFIESDMSGKGLMEIKDGSKYEGEFYDNKYNGIGTLIFVDGDYVTGNWIDGKVNGWGKYYLANGNIEYDGEYRNNLKHGNGYFYDHATNTKYYAEWADNEIVKAISTSLIIDSESLVSNNCVSGDCENGWGRYVFANGFYEGFWQNSLRNGYGVYHWTDIGTFKGNWVNNQRNGFGIYSADKGYVYIGMYRNDKANGFGIDKNNGTDRYGFFTDDVLTDEYNFFSNDSDVNCIGGDCQNKYGRYKWSNGNYYTGFFKDGNFVMGILRYTNGDSYVGLFKDNIFDGTGFYYFVGGNYYEGEWEKNNMNGKGYYFNAEDSSESFGIWKNDSIIESYK